MVSKADILFESTFKTLFTCNCSTETGAFVRRRTTNNTQTKSLELKYVYIKLFV